MTQRQTATATSTSPLPTRSLIRNLGSGVALAALINVVLFVVGTSLLGGPIVADMNGVATEVTLAMVVAASVIPTVLGALALIFSRRIGRHEMVRIGVVAIAVLSLAGPLTSAATVGGGVTLALMHLGVLGGVLMADRT